MRGRRRARPALARRDVRRRERRRDAPVWPHARRAQVACGERRRHTPAADSSLPFAPTSHARRIPLPYADHQAHAVSRYLPRIRSAPLRPHPLSPPPAVNPPCRASAPPLRPRNSAAALYTVLLVQSWQADTLALMFSPRGLSLPSVRLCFTFSAFLLRFLLIFFAFSPRRVPGRPRVRQPTPST